MQHKISNGTEVTLKERKALKIVGMSSWFVLLYMAERVKYPMR